MFEEAIVNLEFSMIFCQTAIKILSFLYKKKKIQKKRSLSKNGAMLSLAKCKITTDSVTFDR